MKNMNASILNSISALSCVCIFMAMKN